MPLTYKHDMGKVRRWFRDGLELNKVYMNASPWVGGPNGLVFTKVQPISAQKLIVDLSVDAYCTMTVNFKTGYMYWNFWSAGDVRDFIFSLNEYSFSRQYTEYRPGNSGGQGGGGGAGSRVQNPQWGYMRHYTVPSLIVPDIEQYTNSSISLNVLIDYNGKGMNFTLHQHPSAANGWVGVFTANEGIYSPNNSGRYRFECIFNGS